MTVKFILILCIQSLYCFGQENLIAKKYGDMVDSIHLKDNLNILASDALEGRYTGARGQKMAAAFIANYFKEIGLDAPVNGSYFQSFNLTSIKLGETYMVVNGVKHSNFTDIFYTNDEETNGEVKTEVIFVGKGRDEDFAQVDIKEKSVMCWIDELTIETAGEVRQVTAKAKKLGARHVLVAISTKEGYKSALALAKQFIPGESLAFDKPDFQSTSGRFYISPAVAEQILNIKTDKLKAAALANASKKPLKGIKPGWANLRIHQIIGEVSTENVLGYLPGTDKKDELIVVTAHYDHIGKNEIGDGDLINNGADDDGSGTVAVLELARIFAQARNDGAGPRRSMLFMTFTGEEEGLFGSEYYVNNPVFPLEKTVVDLNLDMVGRVDDIHKSNKNFVYVIGADRLSSELHEINERNNKTYTHLTFDYTYNDVNHPEQLYYRSDHWNFAKENIPIIFYTNGVHADYHQVSDEVSKIEFEPLTLRTRGVFYTAWEIASREERLKVDKKPQK